MDEFGIKDVDSSASLQFEGRIPRDLAGYDGCAFVVRLSSAPISANIRAYDIRPEQWSEFFADLAENWRGWNGVKDHESLEGHLRLEATSDGLGHIRLLVRLRGIEAGTWSAEASMTLEAGQLEGIAAHARIYFG